MRGRLEQVSQSCAGVMTRSAHNMCGRKQQYKPLCQMLRVQLLLFMQVTGSVGTQTVVSPGDPSLECPGLGVLLWASAREQIN